MKPAIVGSHPSPGEAALASHHCHFPNFWALILYKTIPGAVEVARVHSSVTVDRARLSRVYRFARSVVPLADLDTIIMKPVPAAAVEAGFVEEHRSHGGRFMLPPPA